MQRILFILKNYMKYLRAFKNKQDYSKEIGDKLEIDYTTVSLVLDDNSVYFNPDVTREAYFNVTDESDMTIINDYRVFSEIYLNDGTENLVPKLVEGSFTIDANDLVQLDEMTWRNTNPKKYNSTYVNSFIVSCDEEILDDYYMGFSVLGGFDDGGGELIRDITVEGTLNELFYLPTRINSNTIDLTHLFIMYFDLVSSLNVVIFKPNENGDLTPLTTTNSYVANIIEEKTYDISETPFLNDYVLLDFTLKCEEDILPTDILFTYGYNEMPSEVETIEIVPSDENNGIVSWGTIEQFLEYANDEGLCIGLIDTKTLGRVSGEFPPINYVKLYGLMRDGVVLTQKVNILGLNISEFCNYSLSTDKLGENKIEFKIPNRFRSPIFWNSNNLTRLNYQALKYNKTIMSDAFNRCTSLTSVTIPDGVTSIENYAFSNCTGLTSVIIPDSVTSIGEWAFSGCNSLTSITIPDSITTMGSGVFNGCDSLTAFYGEYASEDNRCLVVDGVLKGFAPAELTEYTIPDGVTLIGEFVFKNCTGLTSVTIPDSVTSIGDWAFDNCTSLSNVAIGDGVTEIGYVAFQSCYNLKSVTIGNSVTTIEKAAFYNCTSLTSVTIPDSVTTIGEYAFHWNINLTSVTIGNGVTTIETNAFYNCRSLTSVTIHATTAPSLGTNSFSYIANSGVLRVPTGSNYSTWQTALPSGWTIEYI